jgi:photosystem II stability/assembly factor-like uncharacterized protein
MQTRADLRPKPGRTRRRRKKPRPPGGKVLQRLFTFLGQRDPALNDYVVATVPVPRSVCPTYALTTRALNARPVTARSVARKRTPVARPFAAEIVKAAARLPRTKSAGSVRSARATSARKRKTAPPTGAPGIWQEVGPRRIPDGQTYGSNRVDVAGRVAAIAVDPGDPAHILLAAAGGGIWETRDTGATWEPRTDHMPSLAIGAVAFDPKTPTRVYAGSGEGNFYFNLGAGVYKSTNGGTTWTVLASSPFVGVGFYDLIVDPKTPSTLYAGTTNGFYKSTNSGASWSLKQSGECWDISVHPDGGTVEILAAFANGLFVSTNAGSSFTAVALPSEPSIAWTRLGVDRVVDAPDVAYVFGAAGSNAFLWRRSGTTWQKLVLPAVNHNPNAYFPHKLEIGQAQYDWCVAAPPNKTDEVYVGAIDTFRGRLSGSTWAWQNVTTQGTNSVHPDQHCLVFAPGQSKILYSGNDGGIYRSTNSGGTWKSLNKGLGICELEYLACDPNSWEGLIAGTQDNGTIRHEGNLLWDHIADGDGGDCGINQIDPNVMYHSFFDVTLERSANKGDTWTDLDPPPFSAFSNPPTSLFYPPVEVSGLTVAIGAKSMVVTRTGKKPWDTVPLGMGSGELPSAMREIDANTLLVGTTAGRMIRMAWNGSTWAKTILTAPSIRYISCIAVDPSNSQRIWVTISQVGGGRVFRSDDGGSSWTNRSAGLPNIPFNAVVVDPANFRRVWTAADVGVYETQDLGASWTPVSNGLPNAMAVDLILHRQDRALVCATRNRGAWVMPVP